MRTVVKIAAVVACALLLASPAVTQQKRGKGFGGGFGGPVALLMNEGVQKELKLAEDQIEKTKEISQKTFAKIREETQDLDQQERFGEKGRQIATKINEEAAKEIAGVLKPEQNKRLKQIQRQQQSVAAFQDAEVQKALKLSDEQKENIKTIAADYAKDIQELRQGAFAGGFNQEAFQEMQKKTTGLQKDAMDKATALLNADQKKELKDLMGEPFKLEMRGFGGLGKKKQ